MHVCDKVLISPWPHLAGTEPPGPHVAHPAAAAAHTAPRPCDAAAAAGAAAAGGGAAGGGDAPGTSADRGCAAAQLQREPPPPGRRRARRRHMQPAPRNTPHTEAADRVLRRSQRLLGMRTLIKMSSQDASVAEVILGMRTLIEMSSEDVSVIIRLRTLSRMSSQDDSVAEIFFGMRTLTKFLHKIAQIILPGGVRLNLRSFEACVISKDFFRKLHSQVFHEFQGKMFHLNWEQ
jgi:hypothetical protein